MILTFQEWYKNEVIHSVPVTSTKIQERGSSLLLSWGGSSGFPIGLCLYLLAEKGWDVSFLFSCSPWTPWKEGRAVGLDTAGRAESPAQLARLSGGVSVKSASYVPLTLVERSCLITDVWGRSPDS